MGLVPSETGCEGAGIWLRGERLLNSQPPLPPLRLAQWQPQRGQRQLRTLGGRAAVFSGRMRVAAAVWLH
jgi:hypothetical protein